MKLQTTRALTARLGRLLVAVAIAISGVLAPTTVQRAFAMSVFFNGYGGDSYASYGPNATVTISGDMSGGCFDIFGQFTGYVYVVPHQSVPPSSPHTFDPSAANAVINSSLSGGLFIDETIGFTAPGGKLGAGDYDIVINTCAPSIYQPGSSLDYGYDAAHGAFSVAIPANVPALPSADIAAIKSNSQQEATSWDKNAKVTAATFAALDTLAIVSNYLTLAESPLEAIGTYAVGFYLDWVCAALPPDPNGAPVTWYCPTVGWGDVLRLQIGAVKEQEAQAAHYQAIANDPPDANFRTLAPLDPTKTYLPNTRDPIEGAATSLATQVSTESATLVALLHAVERYQGAQQASDGPGALLQAQAIKTYASMLSTSLTTTNSRLGSLSSAASARDLGPSMTYMSGLLKRLQTGGMTANEIAGLHAAGLADADITRLRTLLTETAAGNPNANYTLDWLQTRGSLPSTIAQLQANNSTAASAFQQLATDMAPIITNLQGQVGATLPTANAGGPYTGTVGATVAFNATGSTTPAGTGPLSYAWDLTGAGTFTDATGVSPTFTFAAPRSGLVGVQVTNASGGTDIAYAPITVTPSQTPPSVDALTPAGPVQNVAPGTTVDFSANVTHTASGPIAYQWKVDGASAGSGTTYSRLFGAADVGLHSVELTVTDAGGSSSRRLGVLVAPPLPLVAAFTPPTTAMAADPVQFTDSSTGPIARWSWDFGDGTPATPSTSTLQNPTHTYASAGTYQVALTVTDGSGGTNQVIQPVVVQSFHVTHQDTFAGPALDPFWTWNAGGLTTNGYAFTPAGLSITASNTDYTPSAQSDPRVETTQSGDWTTTLQVKALVQQSYDMVGLLGSDPTNPAAYWKFGYAQDNRASALPSIVLYDAAHAGGLVAAVPFPSSTTPYLQVVKTGTSYSFAYSLDGSTWSQLAQATYPFGSGPVRIAPFAQGTSRTFSGTIVQLAFNTSLPGAANPTAVTPPKPTFADNFGGPTLDNFWSFNQGSNAADSYLFTRGGLALTSSATDYYPGNTGNPYLYTSQSGDWDARVHVDATVSQNYDEIGLIVINPSNPNAFWKDGFGFAGGTYVDVYDGSGHGGPTNVFPTTASPYLRATRVGDVYTFYYSSDGTTWTQNYQGVWHFGDTVRLGLFAQGTSRTFTGRFEQFALNAPLPALVAATPGVLFNPTGESTNVALDSAGATITASSGTYGGGYLPAQMLSAAPTAPWVTPYSQTANQYATIQLAGNRTYLVDHVQIQPRTDCCGGQRPQTFAIETSVDGATFTPALYGVIANTANLQDFAVSPPAVARYVRYRPLDNWGDNCCISTEQLKVMTGQTGGPTVTFQNLSSAGFGAFHWDFGDGSSSTESSPSHTFAAPGDYTVTLTASNGSTTSSFSLVQHVLASTNLALVALPATPTEGQSTQFTATLTPPTGAHITQATLDFGDTFSASVLAGAVTHIFQSPGTYTLKLTTVDDRGTITSIQQPLTVSAGPTIATQKAFFDPQSGGGRNVALLEAGARVDAVSGQYGGCYTAATLLNYVSTDCSWASAYGQTTNQWIKVGLVGDKTYQIDHVLIMPRADYQPQRPINIAIDVSATTDDDTAFTRVLAATLADNGSLQDLPLPRPVLARFVRYREFDNRGDGCCISTSQLKIMTGQEGNQTVTFNNLSTPDKVTFHWDFGDGASSTDRSPSHTFPSGSASYTVRLQATDASGVTDSYELTQRVLQPPVVSFAFAAPAEGQAATFTPTVTDPDGGTFVQATWNWGDGSPATVVGPGSVSQPVTHVFPNNNQYSVNLQVVDDQEQLGQFTLTVPVANLNPIVNAGPDQTTIAGQPLIFSTSVSRPGTLDVPSCTWAYGDGTTSAPSSDCNFNHTYTNVLPGQAAQTVTATLTATNPDGAVGTGTVHVTITPGTIGLSTTGELFYTRYCGGPNVRQVQFAFDGTYGFTLQTPTTIASVNGADGVVFAPDGDLLVGGQGPVVHKVNPKTGAVQDGGTGGPAAFHLALDPSGRAVWAASIPGEPAVLPLMPHVDGTPGLSIGTGTPHPLSGDNTILTSLAFVNGQTFYTSSGSGGYGDVGTLDTSTFTTHRFISSLPAAHGMVYDRFTGSLLLFGSNHITQIDPASRAVVSDRYFSPAVFGVNFDQGTADGKGHILVADNGGHLLFMDYSAKKLVGDPMNFVALPYLDSCLDDVAPLSGVGSADELPPISTLVATPPANSAGWNNTAVDLQFSATDSAANNVTPSGVARITAKDGSTDLACPTGAACTGQLTSEGTHVLSYFATDNAGNVEAPPHAATIKIDRSPPQTTFQLAGGTRNPDGSYSAAPNVTLIGSDPALSSGEPGSGVAATYYQVVAHTSGGRSPATTPLTGWSTYSAPFALAKDGDWDIWAVSADVAGNVATPILVGEFVVSTTAIVPPTGGGVSPGATPELDSFMLLASGLAGLAGYARLRQRACARPAGPSSTRRRNRPL